MTTTASVMDLARLVGHPDHAPALDHWETSQGCMAWVSKSNRRCGRTAPAPLCEHHELAARRRWAQNMPAPMTHDEARAAVELSNALDGQIGFTP